MADNLKRIVANFLAAHAFTDITFDHAGGHQRVRATRAGRTATLRFSTSPSSVFAARRVIADIRRLWSLPARSRRSDTRPPRAANRAGRAARAVLPASALAPVRADHRDALAAIGVALFGDRS